jgi:hypothetical protein
VIIADCGRTPGVQQNDASETYAILQGLLHTLHTLATTFSCTVTIKGVSIPGTGGSSSHCRDSGEGQERERQLCAHVGRGSTACARGEVLRGRQHA